MLALGPNKRKLVAQLYAIPLLIFTSFAAFVIGPLMWWALNSLKGGASISTPALFLEPICDPLYSSKVTGQLQDLHL